MSGGSRGLYWDYNYGRFADVGDRLRLSSNAGRRALGTLVLKVVQALHDIEWVDSGAYGPDEEDASISACLPPALLVEEMKQTVDNCKNEIERLQQLIQEYTHE